MTLRRHVGPRHRATGATPADDLPVHFFTIVLNGEPFIRYHLDVFRQLPFRWHWHVVEGVASLVHDTAWSMAAGGRIDPASHQSGLSNDGTTGYLDAIAASEPTQITIYRKPPGTFWDGKREMVSAPLSHIREQCLLFQVDSDELWTVGQLVRMRELFMADPARSCAYYWCDFFVGPDAVVTTRYNYGENPDVEWLRTWRYREGDRWDAHEPPTLMRARRWRRPFNVGRSVPFAHAETEREGLVFQHFAYATEEQVRFKQSYYGYDKAVEGWRSLQDALTAAGPVRLGDYLPWVTDETLADRVARSHIAPVARPSRDGTWVFGHGEQRAAATSNPNQDGIIVIDGVFFQDNPTTGIARVWQSYLREWLRTGFADRVVFLDRGGAGPRFPGLRTRSVPLWRPDSTGDDSLMLQRVCDEENAALFVSTYYTAPIATPSLMLVHDMIPERLGLDTSDTIWDEKRLALEHASTYVCVSDNTRSDLFELEPGARAKRADVVRLGVDRIFRPASTAEIEEFRRLHCLDRPYLLIVGERRGVDGYKNVRLGFRAFGRWTAARDHEIVCVGGHPKIERDLVSLASKARIRRLGLDDEQLRLAYAGAEALVYPSRYEGFGLPVVEAMACGCPVITTPAGSLPEVGGDAVIYVDPDDLGGFIRAFDAVREPRLRAAMTSAGLARATLFDWSDAAAKLAVLVSRATKEDSAGDRVLREEVWLPRRRAQAASQPALRARLALERSMSDDETRMAAVGRCLRASARQRLPPWMVKRLRALRLDRLRRRDAKSK